MLAISAKERSKTGYKAAPVFAWSNAEELFEYARHVRMTGKATITLVPIRFSIRERKKAEHLIA